MDALNYAKEIKEQITAWRRDLHRIPELGLDLPKTKKYVCEKLDRWDVPYTEYDDCSGVVAPAWQAGQKSIGT